MPHAMGKFLSLNIQELSIIDIGSQCCTWPQCRLHLHFKPFSAHISFVSFLRIPVQFDCSGFVNGYFSCLQERMGARQVVCFCIGTLVGLKFLFHHEVIRNRTCMHCPSEISHQSYLLYSFYFMSIKQINLKDLGHDGAQLTYLKIVSGTMLIATTCNNLKACV